MVMLSGLILICLAVLVLLLTAYIIMAYRQFFDSPIVILLLGIAVMFLLHGFSKIRSAGVPVPAQSSQSVPGK
jgi:uncharacterized membrane protein YphA (DoxX/SURF4 family)